VAGARGRLVERRGPVDEHGIDGELLRGHRSRGYGRCDDARVAATVLITDRLRLRGWRDEDADDFARLVADPSAMRFYPSTLTRSESDDSVARMRAHLDEHAWGQWVVTRRDDERLLGVAGLWIPTFEAPFTPCVEVGWRFLPDAWGNGYATEAGGAALRYGFETLKLDEIVSMTTVANLPSRRVMERLGMIRDPADDFDHPFLPQGHPLRPHVLYRLRRPPSPTASTCSHRANGAARRSNRSSTSS